MHSNQKKITTHSTKFRKQLIKDRMHGESTSSFISSYVKKYKDFKEWKN